MKRFIYKDKKYFQQKFFKDVYFNSYLVTKFINQLNINGKRILLRGHLHRFIIEHKKVFNLNFKYLLIFLLMRLVIMFKINTKQIAGKAFSFPVPIQINVQYRNAMKLFCNGLSEYFNLHLKDKIKTQFSDVMQENQGTTVKAQQTLLESISDNRIYSHFRWS